MRDACIWDWCNRPSSPRSVSSLKARRALVHRVDERVQPQHAPHQLPRCAPAATRPPIDRSAYILRTNAPHNRVHLALPRPALAPHQHLVSNPGRSAHECSDRSCGTPREYMFRGTRRAPRRKVRNPTAAPLISHPHRASRVSQPLLEAKLLPNTPTPRTRKGPDEKYTPPQGEWHASAAPASNGRPARRLGARREMVRPLLHGHAQSARRRAGDVEEDSSSRYEYLYAPQIRVVCGLSEREGHDGDEGDAVRQGACAAWARERVPGIDTMRCELKESRGRSGGLRTSRTTQRRHGPGEKPTQAVRNYNSISSGRLSQSA
ncbi:hypothetical protein FB451DRAFT_1479925 [Mycena latifolia]|nr:hypothetical protein FB451DRAFT_1479925 [Mycena latifolia]